MPIDPKQGREKVRENRLRRQAKRLGLYLMKSRARKFHVDDRGGYSLRRLDDTDIAVHGPRNELTLDDVEEFLQEREAKLQEGAEDE